ncbi:MAG: 5-oxoprolinase subunit PxpB [Pirellulales bacterium]|nr:5-oxoprolinase subunit PxpB [Pirellulales bacterium]
MTETQIPTLKPVGENALLVEFEPEISVEVNLRVRRLVFALEQAKLPGVAEIIPAYRSLIVYFDVKRSDLSDLMSAVHSCQFDAQAIELPQPRLFQIPTVYGGKDGPDLWQVATEVQRSPDDVVTLFSTRKYPVYCLGFLCSLPYLGGVPRPLNVPRRSTPRMRVPAGSVGIAGRQAVVLPIEMPSGFHYLGRTRMSIYDPARIPPTAIRPGDLVEFPAVSGDEAEQWSGRWLDCPLHAPP